jgi:hypothetical protein
MSCANLCPFGTELLPDPAAADPAIQQILLSSY